MIKLHLRRKLSADEKNDLSAAKQRLTAELASVSKTAERLGALQAKLEEVEAEQSELRIKAAPGTDRKAITDFATVTHQKAVLQERIENTAAEVNPSQREPLRQAVNDAVQLVGKLAAEDLNAQLDHMVRKAYAPFHAPERLPHRYRETCAAWAVGRFFNPSIDLNPLNLMILAERFTAAIDALLAGEPIFTFQGAAQS